MDLSIKNTTRKKKKKIVKEALAISISGTDIPDINVLNIAKEYVDGKTEIENEQKKVIALYQKEDN